MQTRVFRILMTSFMIPTLTLGAVASATAVAHADPYEDLAHVICRQLAAGESADQIVDSMVKSGQVTRVNAMETVAVSVRGFCPNEQRLLPGQGN